ncbi:hypothetical protein NADFUDRAFT_83960 [Nadsonia fulvescens var. elongata DSM 6958]|uniref:TPR-like protein n=1 Tax=Nadsonia fulvescens var. elongata DSM 6958 TaxID=857566 RepID=A0A1E3PG67_9ASCO|nr:hypothetical protein NADFUDRAFT_83960 [Nadsonia fulvescens var. elongata DSM 6958]
MSQIESAIKLAREHLDASAPESAIQTLMPLVETNDSNITLLQVLGEAFLEYGDTEQAYNLFIKASELDPTGSQGGMEKFLWLGQIVGGRSGEVWFQKGMELLRSEISKKEQEFSSINDKAGQQQRLEQLKIEVAFLKRKLCEALCGVIEIWMTDLCMEPEAESKCDGLITESLLVDNTLAESWTVLGSIRISQQRNEEAVVALAKAWDLYKDELDPPTPSLLTLARYLVEMKQDEIAVECLQKIQDLDEAIVEVHYLEGFVNFNAYKAIVEKVGNLISDELNEEKKSYVADARMSFKKALHFMQFDENVDAEIKTHIEQMLNELASEPESEEIAAYTGDINEENLEDFIEDNEDEEMS